MSVCKSHVDKRVWGSDYGFDRLTSSHYLDRRDWVGREEERRDISHSMHIQPETHQNLINTLVFVY